MKLNENRIDRIIRVLLAAALGGLVALKVVTGITAVVFAAASAILFLTGVVGFCGIYAFLGLSTCKVPRRP